MNSTFETIDEEKKAVIIEVKTGMQNIISGIRSKEIDLILEEESPFNRRKNILTTAFEILLGAYIGIMSVYLVIAISELLS